MHIYTHSCIYCKYVLVDMSKCLSCTRVIRHEFPQGLIRSKKDGS